MFERRQILVALLAFNLCVLIWRISVQDTTVLDTTTYSGYTSGAKVNFPQQQPFPVQEAQGEKGKVLTDFIVLSAQQHQQKEQELNYYSQFAGKQLLSKSDSTNESYPAYDETTQRKLKRLRKLPKTTTIQNKITESYSNNKKTLDINKLFKYQIENVTADAGATPTPLVMPVVAASLSSPLSSLPQKKSNPASESTSAARLFLQLPPSDAEQLIDLHDFKYLMPKSSCHAHIEALIVVHSAPINYEKRALIRETWGGDILRDSPLRLLFLIGAVEETAVQMKLLQENTIYDDIVQGTFIDNYRNMTYKHVMALKWFLYNCAHAQLLIKVDDDVFVNTPQLLKYVSNQEQARQQQSLNHITTVEIHTADANSHSIINLNASQFNASQTLFQHPKNLIFCEQHTGAVVKRTYRSKWRVSFKEYPKSYYPPYCPGYAIIYSSDVVQRLYVAAQQQKYFWIDDVHITGSLAQMTNTNITTLLDYVLYSKQCEGLLAGETDLSEVEFLFAWHSISPQQMRALWRLLVIFDKENSISYPHHTIKLNHSTVTSSSSESLHEIYKHHLETDNSNSYDEASR